MLTAGKRETVAGRPSYPAAALHYELPPELIAQHPPAERGASRLLHVRVVEGSYRDCNFSDLPDLLPSGCALVLNDSRVIPARVLGQRTSGARVELLYQRWLGSGRIKAVVGSNARLPIGERILLPNGWFAQLLSAKSRDGSELSIFQPSGSVPELAQLLAWLEDVGGTPLPPYIKRPDDALAASDAQRYQTVYASEPGSVAAPTAGLHFTDGMLERLDRAAHPLRRVTLHVGLATFAPLRVADLADHALHREAYSLPSGLTDELGQWRAAGRPICAVGTTSLRVLHTLFPKGRPCLSENAGSASGGPPMATGETAAFIYPGQGTHAAELLLTNFHLPGSTLLALVYAFGGEAVMRAVYAHAIAERYRFFSYGDCMLIDRRGARLTADGTVLT